MGTCLSPKVQESAPEMGRFSCWKQQSDPQVQTMTCQPPRAPRHPGMKTSSLMLFLSPTQGPEEDPQARLGPQGRRDHQGLQVPQAPKVTGARQERKAQQGLPASWGHQGPAGFLERWGALDPLAPPAQQAARASLQMAPKASSTPCSHLPTRTLLRLRS
uniref:Collagen type XXVI alpha 1 chain n=1 Tax=Rousettus aegyptiacus TaxID=9407 RepID=A0A7J8EYQ8_ROUAE|nr:collagen type XXVI alpha 1 chain [Rousettus aegyptiacus]